MTFEQVREQVIALQLQRGINPTNGRIRDYFARTHNGDEASYEAAYKEAETAFHVGLRRELSQRDFALEPLGLAYWRFVLPELI